MRKKKYNSELIIQIIRENINEGISVPRLAERYNIHHGTIEEWIIQYKQNGAATFSLEKHNRVYSEEKKNEAVKEYLAGGGSLREIAAKYKLRSKRQLQQWIKVYNSGKGFQRKMTGGSRMKKARLTTLEERIQIAKDCIANGENYGETALKHKVSYQQVYQWTKKFKEMGAAGLEDRRGKRKKDQTPRTELEKAQIEIERLKHELYMTQMERDLLKKLDEIERREVYRK